MLRARPHVDPHAGGLRQIVAERVGVGERSAPLPILGRGLRVDDQGVGLRALQDRVAPSGQVIGRFGIGEREAVGRIEVVFVLLAAGNVGIGEAVVEPHSSGSCHMRQNTVEHSASGSVGVKPAIDEIAQAATGLRTAPGIGPFDRCARFAQRVDASSRVFLAVPQETDEIPDGYVAQTEHKRVTPGIDQLINPARLEPARDVDVGVGWDQRSHGTLIVEAGAAFDPGKAPAVGWHRYPLVIGIAPSRQARLARVERHRRMAARRDPAAQREGRDAGAVGDVFDADETGQRPVALARDRQVEQHSPIPRQQIALPGEPGDRVAAAHQKAVPRMRQGARVVRSRGVVEELQHPLVAAIAVIEKDAAVAACGIDRLQDREIASEMDEALGIGRRLVDIGDAALRRSARVDREVRATDQAFIRPDRAECVTLGKDEAFGDRQLHPIGHPTCLQKRTARSDYDAESAPWFLSNAANDCIDYYCLLHLQQICSNDFSLWLKPRCPAGGAAQRFPRARPTPASEHQREIMSNVNIATNSRS